MNDKINLIFIALTSVNLYVQCHMYNLQSQEALLLGVL